MRQVDHEAGIAFRGPFCQPAGLQHDDPRTGIEGCQPPRRGNPGESAA